MKKSIYLLLFIIAVPFSGCITNDKCYAPIDTLSSARLKIVNYPTNSNNYILGAGDYIKEVDFVLRDCFTDEYILCTDSAGNIKNYIILYLGEGDNADTPGFLENMEDLFKEDGDEYYVKIYIAQHKKIDYKEQLSKPINYLDTIEVDIDDNVCLKHEITFNDTGRTIWYKGRKIPSYRLLSFWPYQK